jgi:hypothetical protein
MIKSPGFFTLSFFRSFTLSLSTLNSQFLTLNFFPFPFSFFLFSLFNDDPRIAGVAVRVERSQGDGVLARDG